MSKVRCIFAACVAVALSSCASTRSQELLIPNLASSCEAVAPLDRPLVVANYNIKAGTWTSLAEVREVLEALDADVIALEEVDNGADKTGNVDQSAELAASLGMQRVFAAALARDNGTYGVAVLSRLPFLEAKRFDLPMAGGAEPRVALDTTVCVGPEPVRFVSTHADFLPWSAQAHARAIADYVAGDDDVVVLGDLNMTPDNSAVRTLVELPLFDALAHFDEGPTFHAGGRIDYILTDREVVDAHIVASDVSDHRPVLAALRMSGAPPSTAVALSAPAQASKAKLLMTSSKSVR